MPFDDLCCTFIPNNWFDKQFRKWKSAIVSIYWFSGRLCLNQMAIMAVNEDSSD